MPDMRDAIAQYLAYSGGQMPQGGFPGMGGQALPLEAYQQLPSGQYLPNMLSDTYIPPGAQTPPSPDYTGPQPTNAPPMPQPVNAFDPSLQPGTSNNPVVDPGPMPTPPVNTPMQGPQIGGMDPNEWYRLYTGGR